MNSSLLDTLGIRPARTMSDAVFMSRVRNLAKSDRRAAIVEKHIAELDQRIASKLAQGLESDGSDRTERRRSANHSSLDKPIGNDSDAPTQHESIAAAADPALAVETEQAITALSRVLSPQEVRIIESREDGQTVDEILNPTIFSLNSFCDRLHLLIVRQRDWQWRRDLLLINHHEVAPSD